MKTKAFFGILLLLLLISSLHGAYRWGPLPPLVDAAPLPLTASITQVRIHGAAGVARIATQASGPYSAQLSTRSAGWSRFWRSAWASEPCSERGTLEVEGNTLHVTMPSQTHAWGWWGEPECTLELQAQLPEGISVEVSQQAARVALDGDFASVAIQSSAGDVALRGHASALAISGDALHAQVEYTHVQRNENIAFNGHAMDIDLQMPPNTPIHYRVEAHASLFNSSLPNTPGALPSITVRGDMVRASIR